MTFWEPSWVLNWPGGIFGDNGGFGGDSCRMVRMEWIYESMIIYCKCF